MGSTCARCAAFATRASRERQEQSETLESDQGVWRTRENAHSHTRHLLWREEQYSLVHATELTRRRQAVFG